MKQALCINKMDMWTAGIYFNKTEPTVYPFRDEIFCVPVQLVDREKCETNPTLLQLIPYVVVRDIDGKIFTYIRGNATGEERLKAKMSIGLGGHVEEMPRRPDEPESLYAMLQQEAARELKEEVGLEINPTQLNFDGFIYEEETDVGKVHLGLLVMYKLDKPFTAIQEEGHIEDGDWLDIAALAQNDIYSRLELWSRAVVDYIVDVLYNEDTAYQHVIGDQQ